MKRTILFLLAAATTFSCLVAQTNKNPFSKLGYKKHIYYTSSKGEFEEFHDNADIVEIGSVYFNTKTNKVVGYVKPEKENSEVATATSAVSVDPLCEKYYWITPYAYCLNNPVKFVDPDGRDVNIWYKDKDGNEKSYRFNGTNKMAPNNQYVHDFLQAYFYNKKMGVGDNLVEAVTNHDMLIYVSDSENGRNHYDPDPSQPTVYWMSRKGLVTTDGGLQSPSTTIEHEMDHAVKDATKPQERNTLRKQEDSEYDNKEEKRVIEGSEAKTAKAKGESTRTNHEGTYYPTISPITTKEEK